MCPRAKKCKTGGWVQSLNLAAKYPKLRKYLAEKRKKNKTGGFMGAMKGIAQRGMKHLPKPMVSNMRKDPELAWMFDKTSGCYHRKRKQTCRRRRR